MLAKSPQPTPVTKQPDTIMTRPDAVDETFDGPLGPRWTQLCPGGGRITAAGGVLRLDLPGGASPRTYSDAQIDDHDGLPLSRFPWRPPLRMAVRARASHPAHPADLAAALPFGDTSHQQPFLRGTAGFGFWNYPLTMAGGIPRLPDALWFFAAAPPSNMALVPGIPGWGWKAQVVHAHRPAALIAGAPALAAILRARITGAAGADAEAARWVRRVTGAHEAPLTAALDEWHDYTLEWRTDAATFRVDGKDVLYVADPPRGPLCFIAWVDNQYAVATPRGSLRFGLVGSNPEWIELSRLSIASLD